MCTSVAVFEISYVNCIDLNFQTLLLTDSPFLNISSNLSDLYDAEESEIFSLEETEEKEEDFGNTHAYLIQILTTILVPCVFGMIVFVGKFSKHENVSFHSCISTKLI